MAGAAFSDPVLKRLAEEVVARALDSNINDLELAMNDAAHGPNTKAHLEALGIVTCHINQYRNRLVPVSWLPDEILLHIFHLAINTWTIHTYGEDINGAYKVPQELDFRSVYRSVLRLQSVCRGWTNLIESDPRFWAAVSPGMQGLPLEKAKVNLAYARLVVLGQKDDDDAYHEPFLQEIAPFSDRFHSLVLTKRWNQQNPFQIWRRPLPNLVKLWLVHYHDPLPPDPDDFFAGKPPPLRFLSAIDSPLPLHPPLYESLEYLSVSGARSLVRTILLDILPVTRHLQTLHLRLNDGSSGIAEGTLDTESGPPLIMLPKLQHISLILCPPPFVAVLLERIQTPDLRTLQITAEGDFTGPTVGAVSAVFHETLRTTERPVGIDIKEKTFDIKTDIRSISLTRRWHSRNPWPDFFVGYEPPTERPITRIALFLGTTDPGETPNPEPVASLNSDKFVFI